MGLKIARRPSRESRQPSLWEVSDELLMQRYLAGESSAYDQLVRRYERELFNYLLRMLGDPCLAEDVFQNTFLNVHVKKHLFQVGKPFRPWLYALATNQAIDAMRRQGRHVHPSLDQRHDSADGEPSGTLLDMLSATNGQPTTEVENGEIAGLVRRSVDDLPEHLRSAIVLCYYQGLKYKDIADSLGIPVGTVKSRLHAAIVRLSETWKRWGLSEESC